MAPQRGDADRRQPAARQPAAVSVRQFHHLAVRDLPVPDLRSEHGRSIRRRDPDLPVQLRARRGGRSATGSSCRISQNTALFSLLGTTYGGDGKSDLRPAQPAGQRADAPGPGARTDRSAISARSAAGDGDAARSRRYRHTRTRCGPSNPATTGAAAAVALGHRPAATSTPRTAARISCHGAQALAVAGGACRTTTCSRT